MEFKTKKPADWTLTFDSQSFEYLIGMFSTNMAHFQKSWINEGYLHKLPQTKGYQKDSHWYSCFLLEYNKTVLENKRRKFFLQMLTYIVKIKVFEIMELSGIKQDGNYLTFLQSKWTVSSFLICLFRLETPKRSNQKDKEPFAYIFKKSRKRIETLFSQLSDQFMLKRNYAKTNMGISVRLLSKITTVTVLQYCNFFNNKPLNRSKYALAA